MRIDLSAFARAATVSAALFAIFTSQASAAPKCGAYSDVTKFLTEKHKENRRALGVINDKAIMEVFISPKGTWTMLVTDRSGVSCILAAGESWDEMSSVIGTGA